MHHVDVRATAHQSDPEEERAKDKERLAKHVASVQEQEDPVDDLEGREHPYASNLDVLEARPGYEHAALVAPVQDHEELLHARLVCSLRVERDQLLSHSVSKAANDTVLEEVHAAQVDNLTKRLRQYNEYVSQA